MALFALLLAVAAGHALLIVTLHRSVVGWGADEAAPQRLEVAFVHALTPSRPVARSAATGSAGRSAAGAPATKGALQMVDGHGAAPRVASRRRPPGDAAADRNAAAAATRAERRDSEHVTQGRDATRPRDGAAAAVDSAAAASTESGAASAPANTTRDDAGTRSSGAVPRPVDRASDAAATSFATAAPTHGSSAPEAAEEGPAAAVTAAAPGASTPADQATRSLPHDIWPPSTRLSYTLTGNYRGAIGGTARVQWVHVGTHYQVQMDVTVGLPFAPLMTRRVTSDGEITEAGLQPMQFDELTKRAFQDPAHNAIHFADGLARMSNGLVAPAPAGTQDSASQFVQLTWLFRLHPELLQPGRSITFPLALRGRVQPWTYDVLDSESLYTVFGDVPVVHVKPRPVPGLRNVLGIEIWFAPTLQYLPARILVRENAETYIDLVLHELPLQAAPPRTPGESARRARDTAAGRPPRQRSL